MSETIIYWRGSAEVREDIIHALKESGYMIETARSLEQVLDNAPKVQPLAIIVDGSAGQREASDRIVELSSTEAIQNYPTIFISAQASKRVAVLKARYSRLFAIDLPYHLHQVMRGIQLLIRAGETELERTPKGVAPETQVNMSPASLADEIVDDLLESLASQPEAAEQIVRRRIRPTLADDSEALARKREQRRGNPDPSCLVDTYGGEILSFATSAEDFDDLILVPRGPNAELIDDALRQLTVADPAGAIHARRVAFVSSAIASNLAFTKEREENIRIAGLFLNWAFHESGIPHMQYDFFREPNGESADRLSEGFLESASIVAEKLGHLRASRAIRAAGRYLQRSLVPLEEEDSIVEEAKCALIVELSDRSCWSLGFWNPYGAYRTMRHFRGDSPVIDDQKLVTAMGRVLGEAVTTHVTVGNCFVPRHGAARDSSQSAADESSAPATTRAGGYRALTVQITDLAPGMRLAQPVRSLDGRLILHADVKLDQALLFQLWQLAAVRALSSKVAIHAQS